MPLPIPTHELPFVVHIAQIRLYNQESLKPTSLFDVSMFIVHLYFFYKGNNYFLIILILINIFIITLHRLHTVALIFLLLFILFF